VFTLKTHPIIALAFLLLTGCAPKEQKADFTDFETVIKDDDFRAAIKTGNFVRLGDGYTYYEFENRQADTILVMVHGFSVPSYIWDSTYFAAIKRGYGALRYDTYGRGFSDNPDVNYEVPLFARQLNELLDSLHINKPVNLLGLSDGGRTITVFTAQYPERVKNLIYVDAAGFNNIDSAPPASTAVTEEEILAFKQARYPTMAKGQMGDFYDSIPFHGWDAKYQEVMKYKGFVRALISTQKNRVDIAEEQRKIAASGIPVFAIWGEHDTVVKLSDVTANLMGRMPAVRLTVIPKAGHLPHMEQAWQFNTLLFDNIVSAK
jgi:pimeloyl-ACP methyl ester carboxylesterase